MTPLGLGNDGFGSLRWQAQCCGIAALKPTLGRVPHATTVDMIDMPISGQLLEVEGPLARRAGPIRAMLYRHVISSVNRRIESLREAALANGSPGA